MEEDLDAALPLPGEDEEKISLSINSPSSLPLTSRYDHAHLHPAATQAATAVP